MKALDGFAVTKEEFEGFLGEEITDEQWVSVADEIEGRVANYLDEILPMIVQDFEEGAFDE